MWLGWSLQVSTNLYKVFVPAIHEVATLTSKGQITLPKPICHALGVDVGGRVVFELIGDRVVVTRVDDAPHEDPAIGRFFSLLEKDIESGQHLNCLPELLASAMLATRGQESAPTQEIQGDVAL